MKKILMEITELVIDAKANGIQGLYLDIDASDGVSFIHFDMDNFNELKKIHSYYQPNLCNLNDEYNTPYKEFIPKLKEYLKSVL